MVQEIKFKSQYDDINKIFKNGQFSSKIDQQLFFTQYILVLTSSTEHIRKVNNSTKVTLNFPFPLSSFYTTEKHPCVFLPLIILAVLSLQFQFSIAQGLEVLFCWGKLYITCQCEKRKSGLGGCFFLLSSQNIIYVCVCIDRQMCVCIYIYLHPHWT